MREMGIGTAHQRPQDLLRNVGGKNPQEFNAQIRITEVPPGGETRGDVGQQLRQKEPAVRREPDRHCFREAVRLGLASGADKFHDPIS